MLVAGLLVAGLAAWFLLGLGDYLTLDALKAQQAAIDGFYRDHPMLVVAAFFAVYVILTALSVPGAAIMTLAAGAAFGLGLGTLIVSFASSIGATLAFLASRYLFRDAVQARFGARLRPV
ncbi:MAG TPA: pyridine nucleotide-disulfide oxidoreductase, partial [Novosphingobium sp.]|nr:pyridine nucleotide-disulfide oxidoreductase [Novosphingobium sp.]